MGIALQTVAIPAAPKNDAVTIPSTLPFDFHKFSTCRSLGTRMTASTSKAPNNPNIFRIRNVILEISGVVLPGEP